jgi:hypothetical protein
VTDEDRPEGDFRVRAENDFGRVRRRAWYREVLAKLAGRPNQLLSYEAVKRSLKLGGPIYRGVRTVPVAQIIGSVDRYRDFDEVFLPKQDSTANRWKSIARAFYSDVGLPPVRLYKVGDAYFVVDGHHRVSVAREQGIEFIDAEVQETVSRVPVTADLKAEDLKILHEYRRFLGRTKLDEIRPQQHIRFTVAGGYQQIIEHIATHRHYMQLERQHEVSDAEAVADWYDQVYLPIVDVIRANNVLHDFPGRTESDLYLWIVEHLYFLRETEENTSIEEAAEDYADQYSEKSIKRLVRGLSQAFADNGELPLEVVKAEQAREKFLAETRLAELRPDHNLLCTSDLDYQKLRDHIKKHRYYMGLDLRRDVNEEEAATHWYDEVYLPIVTAIREHDLRSEFPSNTETELYLSIVKYLDQLRRAEGEVSVEEAAVDYAAQFKQHPIKKILGGLLSALVGGEATSARSDAAPAAVPSATSPAVDGSSAEVQNPSRGS